MSLIVGFSAVVLLGYTLLLIGIHMFIPHPSATKRVITLSYVSLIMFALAQTSIVGTYFMPYLSDTCMCRVQWAAACIFYISGLYCLKFIYIERIRILNEHPMLASARTALLIKIVTATLAMSFITCTAMMITLTDGECHPDQHTHGCKPSFHVADIYVAIVMITFDACCFAAFCYQWWSLIKVFKSSADSTKLVEMIQSFALQFVLTVSAMLSCVIDGVINLWYPDYSTLIVFCVDAAIVASCNFAMIKESQAFMWKYLCWPCKIPRYLLQSSSEEASETRPGSPISGNVQLAGKHSSTSPNADTTEKKKEETPVPQLNEDGEIVYSAGHRSNMPITPDVADKEAEEDIKMPSMILTGSQYQQRQSEENLHAKKAEMVKKEDADTR